MSLRHDYVARVATLTLLVFGFAAEAKAQEVKWIGGLGAFVGVGFGSEASFEYGFEAFATRHFPPWEKSGDKVSGVGPLARLSLRPSLAPQLTIAAHGGGKPIWNFPFWYSGELGFTWFFRDNRPAFHTGLETGIWIAGVAVRSQWGANHYFVGGSLRGLPKYGMGELAGPVP